MKTTLYPLIVALLCIINTACTPLPSHQDSQPAYLTTCDKPDCFSKAKLITLPHEKTSGLVIRSTPFVGFNLAHPASQLMTGPSSLIIVDQHQNTVVTFQTRLEDLGLEKLHNIDMYQLMKWNFLYSYTELEQLALPTEVLVSARAFKLSNNLSTVEALQYFKRDDLLIFSFYEAQDLMHKVFIINKNQPNIMINIDIKGISDPDFSRVISSIHQF